MAAKLIGILFQICLKASCNRGEYEDNYNVYLVLLVILISPLYGIPGYDGT